MTWNHRGGTRPPGSRLTESLQRLERTVQSARSTGSEAQAQFDQWCTRWEDSRDQITQRLSLIDGHLQSLLGQPDPGPRLSVHAGELA